MFVGGNSEDPEQNSEDRNKLIFILVQAHFTAILSPL